MRCSLCACAFVLLCTYATAIPRIIGGRPALEGERPYQISLRRETSFKHFCGGTLISPKSIVSAAHCAFYPWGAPVPAYSVLALAGQIEIEKTAESVVRKVEKFIPHEHFDPETMANDISVLLLLEEFPVGTHPNIGVIPMRLKTISSGKCTISGWGLTKHNGERSPILQIADIQVVDLETCQSKFDVSEDQLQPGMFCAGVPGGLKDACQGDSGGPLVCNGLLTATVSTGIECGHELFPGIYSSVVYFAEWIRAHQEHDGATSSEEVVVKDSYISKFLTDRQFLSNKTHKVPTRSEAPNTSNEFKTPENGIKSTSEEKTVILLVIILLYIFYNV